MITEERNSIDMKSASFHLRLVNHNSEITQKRIIDHRLLILAGASSDWMKSIFDIEILSLLNFAKKIIWSLIEIPLP